MPLNVEFLDHDMYDKEFMYRCLFPKEFQNKTDWKNYNNTFQSVMHDNKPVSSMRNSILESIILGSNTENETELIVRPYLHNDKRVLIDHCCEFQEPKNGEFLIEIVPKYDTIQPNKFPEGVYAIRHNHTHCIFRYTLPKRYEGDLEVRKVNIYLSYNPDKTAVITEKPEEIKETESEAA